MDNFLIYQWMQIRRQCAHKHTYKLADEKRNAITKDSVGWQDPIPSETPSFREQVCSEKRKIGTYTWSHADRIQKSPKSIRSFLLRKIYRMDFGRGRNSEKSSPDFSQERVQTSRFIFWELTSVLWANSHEQCFFPSNENLEGENLFLVASGASLHVMSKRDLTQEEKDTIQKSKGAWLIMTANVTTHAFQEATEYVYDLDMFVWVQPLKESPAVLSLRKKCQEHGCSYAWQPGQPPCLVNHGRYIECKTNNHIATEHQTESFEWPEADTSCGRPRAKCRNRITRLASTTHGRIDVVIFKFDRRISTWRGNTTAGPSSFRASIRKTFVKQTRRKLTFIFSFSPSPELRSLQTHERCKSAMQKKSWRSGGQNSDWEMWWYGHSRPQSSQ